MCSSRKAPYEPDMINQRKKTNVANSTMHSTNIQAHAACQLAR